MTSPENIRRYDSALLGILQHEVDLEPFLDVVFGFLFRKTDFYHILTEKQRKYGFPEGKSERLVHQYFHKYKLISEKTRRQPAKNDQKKKAETETAKEPRDTPEEQNGNRKAAKEAGAVGSSAPAKIMPQAPETKTVPLKTQKQFQSNPESYNGAVREKYSWSQNYDDLDVLVPVPKSVTKGRQVQVKFERKHLFVSFTDGDGVTDTVINGELKHEILKDESMWSLEGGKNIQITLTKDTKYWWKALLVNEEEIDIQKIAPERSMADMEEDEVAVINKLQFDEKQKRLGLPQSHELKVHEMLKKGWDTEGSPFKGQQFDPKMFNVSPSGVQ